MGGKNAGELFVSKVARLFWPDREAMRKSGAKAMARFIARIVKPQRRWRRRRWQLFEIAAAEEEARCDG